MNAFIGLSIMAGAWMIAASLDRIADQMRIANNANAQASDAKPIKPEQ